MKHIQNICISMSLIVTSILQVSAATTVTIIDVVDTRTLSIALSEGVQLSDGISKGEIKILQDVDVATATPSSTDPKSVILELETPLQPLTDYSILTVFGMEGSIDFTTGASTASGTVFQNTALLQTEQGIRSLTLEGNTRLNIIYTSEISSEEFEYKVLAGIPVKTIEKKVSDTRLYVTLDADMKASQDYILMTLSLQDANNASVEFDGGIYDFSAPEVLESFTLQADVAPVGTVSIDPIMSIIGEDIDTTAAKESIQEKIAKRNATKIEASTEAVPVMAPTAEGTGSTLETEVELNSAGEETHFVKDIALTAETTPETGAETLLLFLASIVINTFFYFTRVKHV